LELTSLISIRDLSRRLLRDDIPYLNAIVLNAGIGGWAGIDWPVMVWTALTSIRQSTTWPTAKIGIEGLITTAQFSHDAIADREPLLGEVFCANAFGHYMLAHYLMPLFRACPPDSPGRIIWSSSIEADVHHYNPDDHQALKSPHAYEHTKRIADFLALTSTQPSTANLVQQYTSDSSTTRDDPRVRARPSLSTPTIHVCHPGICTTTIIALYWIIQQCYLLGIYLARWLGSPWANVTAWHGAASATWLALASPSDLQAKEIEAMGTSTSGAMKWGSSVDRLGNSYVRVTEIPGWGLDGSGMPFKDKWWGGSLGRKSGSVDATKEDVTEFIVQGKKVWERMEALRMEWEARIEKFEAAPDSKSKSNGHV
jgi:3-keto steroid reductase